MQTQPELNLSDHGGAAAKPRMSVKTLVYLAMLCAISLVVSYLCTLFPHVAGFLKFDLKDTVIAIGGNVSTKTVSGGGVEKGGVSYGLYLPGSSLTLQNGAELTATGGDNPTYSDNYTQKSKVNNSYGAYVGGNISGGGIT